MKTYSRKKDGDGPDVIIHLNELCRLCLRKEEKLTPIFSGKHDVPVSVKIVVCARLEVFEGDTLPTMICHACLFQLDKSYTFKKQCETSDAKLRMHIKMIQDKGGVLENASELMNNTETENPDGERRDSVQEMDANQNEELSDQDLIGARVEYIGPDEIQDENMNPENITLSIDCDQINKEACTLKNVSLKQELLESEFILKENEAVLSSGLDSPVMVNVEGTKFHVPSTRKVDKHDLSAISDAVKTALSGQPGIDLSGPLEIKLDPAPDRPTRVQVTTSDGSIVVMELQAEDDYSSLKKSANSEREITPTTTTLTKMETAGVGVDDDDGTEAKFQCSKCPRKFTRAVQLRRHSSVHMVQQGFSCGICEKWCPTRSALVRHERIHTGERPFSCGLCGKAFSQKEILYRHIMTHTNQKPFTCHLCDRGFATRTMFNAHMQSFKHASCKICAKTNCTHMRKKEFQCKFCFKPHVSLNALIKHTRFHHLEPV